MLLIPAIDLRQGRCVRLRQGDFGAETPYAIEPAALAQRYRALGARWLHLVDLDGARDAVAVNLPLIEALARAGGLRLQAGGGVRSAADVERLLTAGVARVVVGSAAVERPEEVRAWLGAFGAERLCIAFDVRSGEGGEPLVYTRGWTVNSMQPLSSALERLRGAPLRHVLCTDIACDGTLGGPNVALYRSAQARYPELSWQASGGIRDAADLAALERTGVSAAISGTALLEQRIPIEELQPFLPDASSPAWT